jgi:hypothetical protein
MRPFASAWSRALRPAPPEFLTRPTTQVHGSRTGSGLNVYGPRRAHASAYLLAERAVDLNRRVTPGGAHTRVCRECAGHDRKWAEQSARPVAVACCLHLSRGFSLVSTRSMVERNDTAPHHHQSIWVTCWGTQRRLGTAAHNATPGLSGRLFGRKIIVSECCNVR